MEDNLNNNFDYSDIVPFTGEKALRATENLKNESYFLNRVIKSQFRQSDKLLWSSIQDFYKEYYFQLGRSSSWQDFQNNIVIPLIIPLLEIGSTDGITVKGLENIEKNKSYVFISNHRDIILDSAFIGGAIIKNGCKNVQFLTGDNLYINKEAENYFGLLGCVKVYRSLELRKEYEASIKLSSYIYDVITNNQNSIWIASSPGRSKDGIDYASPSIIKMLSLSHRRDIPFNNIIKQLHIIPISISYERDPNDVNKAREIITTIINHKYKKRKLEDLVSITRGICKSKGRITITIDKEITDDFANADELALYIEKRIRLNYELFPFSYYAYDKIHKTDIYKNIYKDFYDKDVRRFLKLKSEISDTVLKAYAAPLESKLLYNEEN